MVDRPSFVHDFIRRLQDVQRRRFQRTWETAELPEYYLGEFDAGEPSASASNASPVTVGANDVDRLVSHSIPATFRIGTGASIYTEALIPALLSARSEIILVTCFWAPSKTLSALSSALVDLAAHRQRVNRERVARGESELARLTVRICLSSRSLFQKLFHTTSRDGFIYPPASWPAQLGLPDASVLEAGRIDLQAKSLFFLPFSVMHPKFLVIDRTRAFVPSCNVSYESWLEACVEFSGDAVAGLMVFYSRTWERGKDFHVSPSLPGSEVDASDSTAALLQPVVPTAAHSLISFSASSEPIQTLLLPSSHHRNPNFRIFPWQTHADAPPTPLNVAVLQLLRGARRSIYLQTPNLTSRPVLSALLDAIQRGVHVNIVTSRNMMIMEQLVTAGTTTAWCLKSLTRAVERLSRRGRSEPAQGDAYESLDRLEAQPPRPGSLRISYYRQLPDPWIQTQAEMRTAGTEEPVQSHMKLTIVDGQYTVLGSGNMDRASWYTSQELGILFDDQFFAKSVQESVETVLSRRLELIFDSSSA